MLASVGMLADPLAPLLASLGGLWLASLGGVSLWCHRLSQRVAVLDQLSPLDPWTELGSANLFESDRWPAALRASEPIALLHIALEQQKQTSKHRGHAIDSRLIQQTAQTLRSGCRRGVDDVFRRRSAADEFLVLVRGPEASHAGSIAQHLVLRLRAQGIAASIGAAWTTQTDHRQRQKLASAAASALRQAKATGHGGALTVMLPASTAEDVRAVPEPIVEEWTDPRRRIGPGDPVASLLYRVRDDARRAFPAHRLSLSIGENLPPLAVDDGRFMLALAALLVHVAGGSRHAHITAGLSTRAGLSPPRVGDAAEVADRMLRVCVEFDGAEAVPQTALLDACKRACEQDGGGWTVQPHCICLAWPIAGDARPSRPWLHLVPDADADRAASAAGGAS